MRLERKGIHRGKEKGVGDRVANASSLPLRRSPDRVAIAAGSFSN